jgi:hypothetical protein
VNRTERRMMAGEMRKQAKAWPAQLEEIPQNEWPARPGLKRPLNVWRSRQFLAQLHEAAPLNGIQVRQFTVNRVTIGSDGHWTQDITWDELQRCKRETGYGDWYALEVYPRDRDLVHVANMRHLWLLSEPLPIGWFEK